jgi:alpha/beta superfamily hydrolase
MANPKSENVSRIRTFVSVLVGALIFCGSALAQDYGREDRIASQIKEQLVIGDAVTIEALNSRPFLALLSAPKNTNNTGQAILLLHGVGSHPDYGVIGQLRAELSDLGYTTLAIQLPIQGSNATIEDYYPKVFGDAKQRIADSLKWLASKGFSSPILLSHSMGSWMANEYLDEHHGKKQIAAWVCMSLTGSYSWTMRQYSMPILDVYAQNDIKPTLAAIGRRKTALTSDQSKQIMVANTGHDYSGKTKPLADEINLFLMQAVRLKSP